MRSDFALARRHLHQAQQCLRGDDSVTLEMQTALSLLVGAALTVERTRNEPCQVLPFKRDHLRLATNHAKG